MGRQAAAHGHIITHGTDSDATSRLSHLERGAGVAQAACMQVKAG